ncbi:permease [Frondihabitans sp. PAMC 28766]|uniref:permease n=1 Tax=Frondihabitans sp. PAMC 28766 TaxID=1795630 RepID=UPI000AF4C2FB|nr:permease [Frondihabitans sp. PAMC 28766]
MFVLDAALRALVAAGSMGWEILWPLILGFTLSGVIQAVVRTERITKLLNDDSPRALSVATGLGALSSSCSYAAVALARALFRKGASFSSAMAFEIASTNLVVELGLILAFVLGWQFTVAEFVGGPLMILLVALGFRLWMRGKVAESAREQADRGLPGSMEGHAGMDMSVGGDQGFWRRLFSRPGIVSTSQYFVMDWASVLRDIVIGLLIAGCFDAWVPKVWLQTVFAVHDPGVAFVIGPLVGPILAAVSFVCSVGNVPLAAVLWNGGISFGGVISFIFADLIIVPIIIIYRRYYGGRAAFRITAIFYGAMVVAGYLVEIVFTPLHLVPRERDVTIVDAGVSWNYTTWLDIGFLVIGALLLIVFVRSGSWSMLSMMGGAPDAGHDHGEMGHEHGGVSHDEPKADETPHDHAGHHH